MSARDLPDEALLPTADTGAPVVLLTGLPGSGKTLFALAEYAVGKGLVYQYGIPECKLPTCDPDKWSTLPKGSTLIVDEAWKHFPPKNANSDPPDHYKIGEIRHTGVSLVLITQHPNDIDARIRRRVGRHVHVVNVFGTEESVLHQKNECFDVETRTDTITKRWPYPKAVYKLYKSADMHRKQPDKPLRLKLLPLMWVGALLLLLGGVAFSYWLMKPKDAPAIPGTKAGQIVQSQPGRMSAPVVPAMSYVDKRQPRIEGLPYTAPVYDEITQPKDAPYPAACIKSKSQGCTCFTQQGTRLDTPKDMCVQIVERGYFLDWKDPVQLASTTRETMSARPGPARDLTDVPEPGTGDVTPRAAAAPAQPSAAPPVGAVKSSRPGGSTP